MMHRALGSLIGVALTAAAPMLGGSLAPMLNDSGVWAQVPPIPLPGPLVNLLTNPGDWLAVALDAFLSRVGSATIDQVAGFLNGLLSSGNIVTQTPPALSYESPVVSELWGSTRMMANAGLAAITAWAGINAMLRPHLREPYHGLLEALPRIVLAAVLVNTSLYWGHFVIDLDNALCGGLGAAGLPALDRASVQTNGANILLSLVAIGIYLIMGLLLYGQMMMRLALVDVLLVIAPFGVLCWALPQTFGWARLWFSTFFATIFVQFIQVLVLRLGSDLITHLPDVFSSGTNPLGSAQVWWATLMLGMAVLQLARKIPRLMPGYQTGAVLTHDQPTALVRAVLQMMPTRSSSGGRR